jgi:hypothetical protein
MWPERNLKKWPALHSSAAAGVFNVCAFKNHPFGAQPAGNEPEPVIPFCYSTFLLRTLGAGFSRKVF